MRATPTVPSLNPFPLHCERYLLSSMSPGDTFLNSLETLTLSPSEEARIEAQWQDALKMAEIAGKPVPHDDAEDIDAASYIENWRAAKVSGAWLGHVRSLTQHLDSWRSRTPWLQRARLGLG